MTSIQEQALRLMFQLKIRFSPFPEHLDVAKERYDLEATAKMFKPRVKLKTEPVNVNSIPAEWITPPQTAGGRTILYLHGGFFMFGLIQSHRVLAGNIAAAAQGRALLIDYSLAPEHPFPAGLDDTRSAYTWLLEQGVRPKDIVLAGDSAGGGLALPAAGVCLSPAADLTMSGESWKTNVKKEMVVNPHIARQLPSLYLPGGDPCQPLASPCSPTCEGCRLC
jgi:acetyl esterase/lipase